MMFGEDLLGQRKNQILQHSPKQYINRVTHKKLKPLATMGQQRNTTQLTNTIFKTFLP